MKGIAKKIIFCIAFFPGFAIAASSLVVEHWETKSGANVYFMPRHELPMVDVQVVFAAGSAYDHAHQGLANFVNTLMPEGANQLSANQITIAFDNEGSNFNNEVSLDYADMGFRSLSAQKYLQPTLKTFNAILANPNFSENDFNRIKLQLLQAIKQDQQSPDKIALNMFYHAIYGDTPYGHPVIGNADSVKAISKKNIIDFYKQYYVKKNAKVIVVGDLTKQQVTAMANQILMGLPEGQSAKFIPIKNTQTQQQLFSFYPSTQNTVIIGETGISRENKNYFPLIVGNHIFGGLPMTSILFQEVRNNRGLVYHISSQFIPLQEKGPFLIVFQTRVAKSVMASDFVKQLLKKYVINGPTKVELLMAKKNLLGSFPLSIASNASIVAIVSRIAFYNLPLDYLQTYRQKIASVTSSQVKNAFTMVVHPNNLSTVVVGKRVKQSVKK